MNAAGSTRAYGWPRAKNAARASRPAAAVPIARPRLRARTPERTAPARMGRTRVAALALVASARPAAAPARPKAATLPRSTARTSSRSVRRTSVAERNVVGREVGVLDVEDRAAEKRPREDAHARPDEAPAQERDEEDRECAPRRRERPARVEDPVPAEEPGGDVPEERADDPGDVERQRPVGEEVRVQLQGRERHLEDGLRDAALVGVEGVALVPVEPEQPDGERAEEEEDQRSPERAGVFEVDGHQIGNLRKMGSGRARRSAMTGLQNHGV